ncbi:sperm-associated antigen 4 protein-like isoform X1 [Pezoporus flaviventris]|uniref:sperm-associated antigen 4 protein-like n=1 Tax=Pezoporus flaviventris TaxID=889875 RepID=UPI002AB1302C|nr:sperm-associated antigen 4 protein-like [Pezoporus flaviventris]XP_061335649.1 sperm-associated antigen 4 protein-like [Pezoporus flaviventris]XP_061335664.1 sperm-associated antigen 4 protein-like isoform X1 [Pezoporus flaviventris]XP_061335665.1 sperm-associated antigen 4 protein-like isoform X1 [Pezoporus flaviventris]
MLRNLHTLLTEQTQKLQLLLEEVAQLKVEISRLKKERQEVNQAALELASEVYIRRSDWALKSSGATIDMQRTSKTYDCKENWGCRVLWFFHTPNPPDTILEPDISPGNCWPLQGHQGQVVIRLPARVHLTAVSVQHTYKEVSPSGTVTSAPRDIAVFGLNADREEETLLGMFVYNVAKEAIQTFPLKVQSVHEGKMPRRKPAVPASPWQEERECSLPWRRGPDHCRGGLVELGGLSSMPWG